MSPRTFASPGWEGTVFSARESPGTKIETSALNVLGLLVMNEQAERLQERTMQFAVDICELIKLLPAAEPGPTVRYQLAKSSTSVAMNYRSSRRARSHAEFTSRIGIVADEADETLGWLEFIDRAKLLSTPELPTLLHEARELRDIFAASAGTARHRQRTEFRK
jgi:four helix bundle protein